MLKIWNAANFRRTTAGLCLVLAPLFFAVALLGPQSSGSVAAQLANLAQHRDQLVAAGLFGIASSILFLPAVFGLLHQIRGRGVVYAHVAGILMIYSLVVAAALGGINLMFWEMTRPGLNRAAMVSLLRGIEHAPVAAPLLAGHYLFVLGILVLGIALWRADVHPRWAAILLILLPVPVVALSPVGQLAPDLISSVISVVGFSALGLRLLVTPDADWAATTSPQAINSPQPQASRA